MQRGRFVALSPEQALIGQIIGVDWSSGAERQWPPAWFQGFDAETLLHWAWQFKMRPMTARALRESVWLDLAPDIRARAEDQERACMMRGMKQIALLRDIAKAARDIKLRILVLKGVALSMRLYCDPLIREAFDLDLLVHPDDQLRLGEVLMLAGCAPAEPEISLPPRQAAMLARYHHDKKFHHRATGLVVEGHRALVSSSHLMATDFDALWSERQEVAVADFTVAMPGDADLVLFLGMHAAKHGWERWKWLADLVALFHGPRAGSLAAFQSKAERAGDLSLFRSWLLLADQIAGVQLPDNFMAAAWADAKARALARSALRLSAVKRRREILLGPEYNLRVAFYRIQIRPTVPNIVFELGALFHRDLDLQALGWSDSMMPLYYVYRPISFLCRRLLAPFRS